MQTALLGTELRAPFPALWPVTPPIVHLLAVVAVHCSIAAPFVSTLSSGFQDWLNFGRGQSQRLARAFTKSTTTRTRLADVLRQGWGGLRQRRLIPE